MLFKSDKGGFETQSTIDYNEIESVHLGGRGALTSTTGGGWYGGGIGLQGAAEGLVLAGALNFLTERNRTTIETIVHLRASADREILMLNSAMAPNEWGVYLSHVFPRFGGKTIRASHDAPASPEPTADAMDPLSKLERLAELHKNGFLTSTEFARAKEPLLAALANDPSS